ncbi:MAG: alcohol dehydrogenase catalytic domain-containing protein [Thermoanaerobacter sp.]|jgi:L-iditol 2-dehydrogenase|nr:alcohol dehydrogenase catalytic domain-containing protein [Thermoanaerobacter sp.]
MKALRLYGPNDLRYEDIPIPEIKKGELLVKIHSCAICGSDLRNIKAGGSSHGMTLPRVLGHEAAGEIVEIGQGVHGFKIGDRVLLSVTIPCGKCDYCLKGITNLCDNKKALSYEYDGCFAEYIAVPSQLVKTGGVIPIPDNVNYDAAAIVEPISCVLNGQELSQVGLNDTVVIIGAGPVGVFHAIIARILGAAEVIISEILEDRIEIVKKLNIADRVINPQKEDFISNVLKVTKGQGADVVIVAAPSREAQEQALLVAKKRGRINFFGGLSKGNSYISIDSNLIHYKELFVHGTSDSTVIHMKKVLKLIEDGRINTSKLITTTFNISEYKEAFEFASSGKALKVIIKPVN